MVNYRGLAVNRQLTEVEKLSVAICHYGIEYANDMHLDDWSAMGPDYCKAEQKLHTKIERADIYQGLKPFDPSLLYIKGKGASQIMMRAFHSFMSRVMKSHAWEFTMRYPRSFDYRMQHTMLSSKLGETYSNGMCRLSDALFLKYAMHVEGEQNVWDIQYKGMHISDNYPLKRTLRLPYPVMWLEAPSNGYELTLPNTRLHRKIEKSGIDAIHKKKIGGILLIEADMIPINNVPPKPKETELALKNMIWQVPDIMHGIIGLDASEPLFVIPQIHKRKGDFRTYLTDYELGSVYHDLFKDDDRDITAQLIRRGRLIKTTTRPIPMHLVEQTLTMKEEVADMLWDVGKTITKTHHGVAMTVLKEERKAEREAILHEFPYDMEAIQEGLLTIKYDGTEDKIMVTDIATDDNTKAPTFHLTIENFPNEGISIHGIMSARHPNALLNHYNNEYLREHVKKLKLNDDALKAGVQGDYTKEESLDAQMIVLCTTDSIPVSSRSQMDRNHLTFASNCNAHLLPQFMIMGFNGESIRSNHSMQQWASPDFERVRKFKGLSDDTKPNLQLKKVAAFFKPLIEGIVPGMEDGMRLIFPTWRGLRDDLWSKEYGFEVLHEEIESGVSSFAIPFSITNLCAGMRYKQGTITVEEAIDRVFSELETTDAEIERYFPKFDHRKDLAHLFLEEQKKKVLEEEKEKFHRIRDMSEGSAFQYTNYHYEKIKNTLLHNKSFCNVPYDTYNYINDDNIQRRWVECLLASKYWIEKKDATQYWADDALSAIGDTEKTLNSFFSNGRSKGAFATYNNMSIAMIKGLKDSYAASLKWHDNKADEGRKLIIASVYSTDGDVLMQLPIPAYNDYEKLVEYIESLWKYGGEMSTEDDIFDIMKEWVRAEDVFPVSLFIEADTAYASNLYKKAHLDSHKHFALETTKLVIGLLEFINRPDVHIDKRPFAMRRGNRLRGSGNKFTKVRISSEEENLVRPNHVLRKTGVVKRYLEMAPIINKRGKLKRHWVSGHTRRQPYPSRGTVEPIWIEGYHKGQGVMSSRPRVVLSDKRGEEE